MSHEGGGVEDQSMEVPVSEHARKCVLCDMALNDLYNIDIETMNSYITKNIGKTHPQKIADDIYEVLKAKLPENVMQHVTREKIVEHIEVHMTHPTVVMTNVVRDLLQIAKTAKASSTIRCEENHIEMIDSKAVNLYLKTIGELQSALRHDALRPASKSL